MIRLLWKVSIKKQKQTFLKKVFILQEEIKKTI